ncbi:hypothetical protein [Geminocystis sp. NIES-3709]|uniref:hypothetical protein n=1 Tax=Geminocystis sp. NIES-3709 TaxID=1617448 RepID=UPI0005FCA39B|nr:hypothetical protein [Geminocystis sp. NIES-3709]BAQ66609.1 hypothetical protein GM3709_3374 [Geminocystis sp. NIES-3709]
MNRVNKQDYICTAKKSPNNCKSKTGSLDKSSLKFLVDKYMDEYRDCYKQEDQWWGDKTLSWEKAIETAWKSRFANGKMHPHQYRVGEKKLDKGLQVCLRHNRKCDSFNDFHDIYCWIESICKNTDGIGSLTTYDIARRLGAWLGKQPEIVYLHAGSMKGAKKLGIKGETVSLNDFPPEIQELGATHAENFLCIYKERLSVVISDSYVNRC